MGKIKEGTNKDHTITTVLTDTFMGIHNYAYMNILMNTHFQNRILLQVSKDLKFLHRCYFQSHFCTGKYTLFRILYYFLCKNTVKRHSFLFYLTTHIIYRVTDNGWILVCFFVLWETLLPAQHTQWARESKQGSESDSRKDKLSSTGKSFKQPDFHLNMEFSSGKLWLLYRLYSIE